MLLQCVQMIAGAVMLMAKTSATLENVLMDMALLPRMSVKV